jgi:hypothetical protein
MGHMLVIPALRRLKQKDLKFPTSLDYIVIPYLRNEQKRWGRHFKV